MDAAIASALLVDDDPASFQSTQRRLEDDGYTVFLARDAAAGLGRAKQSPPNVIFTHLVGTAERLAFIQALRSDDGCRHIPVVVLTGGVPTSIPGRKGLRAVNRNRW